jgi:hypothetical protein
MRLPHLGLLLAVALPCSAAVGHSSDSWGGWDNGAKDPWSFGAIDASASPADLAKAQTEFQQALKETRSSLLAAADQDNSGKLSRFEAREAQPRFSSLRDRARELSTLVYDTDRDGSLSEAEQDALIKAIRKTLVAASAAPVDANHDRQISTEEVTKAMNAVRTKEGALFTLCDRNNDGQLAVQESRLAFDLLAVAAGIPALP